MSGGGGGTTATITFAHGTPVAVATQVGNGAFMLATPGNQVTVTLPTGTTKFALAFVCPAVVGLTQEIIFELTTQDGTAFTIDCRAQPALGTATGSASSAIAGTADIEIFGNGEFGGNVGFASGPFSVSLPNGTNDVAALAIDSSHNVLGAKIIRSQTVPGAINGGSGIILASPGDATTVQNVTVTNIPGGFLDPPIILATYATPAGLTFFLQNTIAATTNPEPYAAIPAATAQSGDFYSYRGFSRDMATQKQQVGIMMTTTSGGGAVNLALPTPWSFAGPAPAKFPTFTYIYSGFNGQASVADQALITWSTGAASTALIGIIATSNFQNSSTTLTIPDLSSLSGFLSPAPTGTNIAWTASIFGGTALATSFTPRPANGSFQVVTNSGSFTQP